MESGLKTSIGQIQSNLASAEILVDESFLNDEIICLQICF